MLKVIVINGLPGSGKDTFVEMMDMAKKFEVVYNLHTSDPVKEALMCLGWDGKIKTPQVRDLLAWLLEKSNEVFDTSFEYLLDKVKGYYLSGNKDMILFVHSREPHNIKRIVERFKAMTILIVRDNIELEGITNNSDKNVANYVYDKIIYNNGTKENLYDEACNLLKELRRDFFNKATQWGGRHE